MKEKKIVFNMPLIVILYFVSALFFAFGIFITVFILNVMEDPFQLLLGTQIICPGLFCGFGIIMFIATLILHRVNTEYYETDDSVERNEIMFDEESSEEESSTNEEWPKLPKLVDHVVHDYDMSYPSYFSDPPKPENSENIYPTYYEGEPIRYAFRKPEGNLAEPGFVPAITRAPGFTFDIVSARLLNIGTEEKPGKLNVESVVDTITERNLGSVEKITDEINEAAGIVEESIPEEDAVAEIDDGFLESLFK